MDALSDEATMTAAYLTFALIAFAAVSAVSLPAIVVALVRRGAGSPRDGAFRYALLNGGIATLLGVVICLFALAADERGAPLPWLAGFGAAAFVGAFAVTFLVVWAGRRLRTSKPT